jgi:hypothetical protein
MKKISIVLLAGFLLAGCIEYDLDITFEPGGAGRLTIAYTVPTSVVKMAEAYGPMLAAEGFELPVAFDEEGLRKLFAGPGISDVKVAADRGEEQTTARVSLDFDSPAAISGKPFLGGAVFAFDGKARSLFVTKESIFKGKESEAGFVRAQLDRMIRDAAMNVTVRLPDRAPERAEVAIRDLVVEGMSLTFPPTPAQQALIAKLDDLERRIRAEGRSLGRAMAAAKDETARELVRKAAKDAIAGFREELAAIRAEIGALAGNR